MTKSLCAFVKFISHESRYQPTGYEEVNENRRDYDVYINPDLKGYDATSFSPAKITDMIKRGEAAGEAVCEQLEQLKLKVLK